ncbi:hypothetical protein RPC_0927 [Rhodopseudomonas palustris BisB18]|uniref:Uncharacterized protein n=1 Tax=Rhodopseudomonas palustris (strain BisB18) TaxID=316056 RepID=Q21AT9_RHOPB
MIMGSCSVRNTGAGCRVMRSELLRPADPGRLLAQHQGRTVVVGFAVAERGTAMAAGADSGRRPGSAQLVADEVDDILRGRC